MKFLVVHEASRSLINVPRLIKPTCFATIEGMVINQIVGVQVTCIHVDKKKPSHL